jgi:hypothetical protein
VPLLAIVRDDHCGTVGFIKNIAVLQWETGTALLACFIPLEVDHNTRTGSSTICRTIMEPVSPTASRPLWRPSSSPTWQQLADIVGTAVPFWHDRLRDPESILAW